jgi:hypothetical protein
MLHFRKFVTTNSLYYYYNTGPLSDVDSGKYEYDRLSEMVQE